MPRSELVRAGLGTLGNTELLDTKPIGLFCSARCPGSLIVKGYDLAVALRNRGIAVISGFQSPMEKECLEVLLRGTQPIIIGLGRTLSGMRVPTEWKPALADRRLLIVSPFDERERRVTASTAARRNEFVAGLAERTMVIHAGANSSTLALCERLLAHGKPVYAIDDPRNEPLRRLGAKLVGPSEVRSVLT